MTRRANVEAVCEARLFSRQSSRHRCSTVSRFALPSISRKDVRRGVEIEIAPLNAATVVTLAYRAAVIAVRARAGGIAISGGVAGIEIRLIAAGDARETGECEGDSSQQRVKTAQSGGPGSRGFNSIAHDSLLVVVGRARDQLGLFLASGACRTAIRGTAGGQYSCVGERVFLESAGLTKFRPCGGPFWASLNRAKSC